MKDVFSFIYYAIKNSFKICQLIRSKKPLVDIVNQITLLNKNKALVIPPVSQKRIGSFAFFFQFYFPLSGEEIVFSPV